MLDHRGLKIVGQNIDNIILNIVRQIGIHRYMIIGDPIRGRLCVIRKGEIEGHVIQLFHIRRRLVGRNNFFKRAAQLRLVGACCGHNGIGNGVAAFLNFQSINAACGGCWIKEIRINPIYPSQRSIALTNFGVKP